MKRYATLILFLSFSLTASFESNAQAKRPLAHRDYDGWRSISATTLSRDGKFLAYGLFPQEGDGEVVVRNLTTNQEWRQKAGERPQPPPPDPSAAEDAPPVQRSVSIAFTADGLSVVFTTFPSRADVDQAKKDKKRAEEMPKGGMVIMSLTSGSAVTIPGVKSFQVPERGTGYFAYLKESTAAPEAPRAEGSSNDANDGNDGNDEQDQRRGGAAPAAGAGGRGRTTYGTDLVLRKTTDGGERTFKDVTEYSLIRSAETLVFTVSSHKPESNGVFLVTPQDPPTTEPMTLLEGKGKYSKLTWDAKQAKLAFLSDQADAAARQPKQQIYFWDCKCGAASVLVTNSTPGIRPGYQLSDRGQLRFSRDSSRLYLAVAVPRDDAGGEGDAPATPVAAAPGANDDKVSADLWHYKDEHIQPMQKVRATQDRNRTYVAALQLSDKKLAQLSTPEVSTVLLNDPGTWAFGTDDRAYRAQAEYNPGYSDLLLVDGATGASKLLAKSHRGNPQWTPDGRYGLVFDGKDWTSISVPDGKVTNLTAKLGVNFADDEHDTPDPAPSFGPPSFTRDSKWALVSDRHDIWLVAPDGSASKNLTAGAGRKESLRFRAISFPAEDEVEGETERGIDPTQPLLLRAENMETHDTGFYRTRFDANAAPEKLIMAAKNFGTAGGGRGGAGGPGGAGGATLLKARQANVVLVTEGSFSEFPNYYVTDLSFKSLKKVTDANPQQAQISWGTSELIHFKNTDGVPLSATLFKPENFDPKKKYPMMVYIYERLSQNVHTYVAPAPGTSINISYYVSNGYLVLTPDIVYTIGYPGPSAMKCVLPAIQKVVDEGFVDEKAIGIQGHSWGGYQIAYMITQTSRFRAAEAGAPVANMISAYNGIRWGPGVPRQFQYEHTQSRIGGTPWEYPERFIQNSPIFQADRVQTPLLILHNDADDAVPWYQGVEYFLALRRLGKEAYLFVYNGEPHGLRRRPDQQDYTIRMQQFFDHFLKGAPEPEWMKNGIPYLDRDQEKIRTKAIGDKP
jgi:dipeptidyl aminopeptidase/acylaminoacyl peptidase